MDNRHLHDIYLLSTGILAWEWSGAEPWSLLTAMNRSYDDRYQAASFVGDYFNHGRVRKSRRVDSNLNMRPLYTHHTLQMRVRGGGVGQLRIGEDGLRGLFPLFWDFFMSIS